MEDCAATSIFSEFSHVSVRGQHSNLCTCQPVERDYASSLPPAEKHAGGRPPSAARLRRRPLAPIERRSPFFCCAPEQKVISRHMIIFGLHNSDIYSVRICKFQAVLSVSRQCQGREPNATIPRHTPALLHFLQARLVFANKTLVIFIEILRSQPCQFGQKTRKLTPHAEQYKRT